MTARVLSLRLAKLERAASDPSPWKALLGRRPVWTWPPATLAAFNAALAADARLPEAERQDPMRDLSDAELSWIARGGTHGPELSDAQLREIAGGHGP